VLSFLLASFSIVSGKSKLNFLAIMITDYRKS